mgnify:FL=1
MKRKLSFLVFVMSICTAAVAQNGHYSYGVHNINGVVNASSAVNVLSAAQTVNQKVFINR